MIQVLYVVSCNLFRNSFFTDSDLASFYSFPTHAGIMRGTIIFLAGQNG